MEVKDILFALLRMVICNETADDTLKAVCTPKTLQEVYAAAKKHDLAHLVGQAVSKLDLPKSEALTKCEQAAMQAVYRHARMDRAYRQICRTLEEAEIRFVPLKGSVLRDYYPEPWMRTSCDIDILVQEEALNLAAGVLCEKLNYKAQEKRQYHDLTLYSPDGINLELHFNIQENMDSIDAMLSKVWDYVVPKQGAIYWYEQTAEYFVFHHIAHMSYHFVHGGCGIKPFLDLYILRNKFSYDDATVGVYCRAANLESFYDNVLQLTDIWFGNATHTEVTLGMQSYILTGGVYGSVKNTVMVQRVKKGGYGGYALSRLFVPYDMLKVYFPILNKHKWLTPVFQVVRWYKRLLKEGGRRAKYELKMNQAVSQQEITSTEALLKQLGL